ncbi:adenosine receptor A2b-like [Amphiura filiformis]|uniref:adenosine receptor A2b-like n=1 Tax=Amphiura filiformis TaxID=82378 RepID=UPI003B20F188
MLSFIVVTANIFCLLVLYRATELRPATKTFMTSLAVSDLLLGLFAISTITLFLAFEQFWTMLHSALFCFMNAFLAVYLTSTGGYSVLFLNIDALIAIVKPLRYPMIMTKTRAVFITLVIWIGIGFWDLLSTTLRILEKSISYKPDFRICFVDFQVSITAIVATSWNVFIYYFRLSSFRKVAKQILDIT